MSNRLNHEKANRRREANMRKGEAIHNYNMYGGKYATDEQLRYLKHLYDIIEKKGIDNRHLPKFKAYSRNAMRSIIKGAITTLKNNGYDTHGRAVNNKKDFLEFMEKWSK